VRLLKNKNNDHR